MKRLAQVLQEDTSGLCAFGVADERGRYDEYTCMPCHAGLFGMPGNFRGTPSVLLTSLQQFYARGTAPVEVAEKYWDWLCHRSPYSSAFKERYENCLVLDVNAQASVVGALCCASRYPWEFPPVVQAWAACVELGMNEDLAFLVAHTATSQDGYFGGHQVLESGTASYQVIPFIRRKFSDHHNLQRSWLEANGEYSGWYKMFPIGVKYQLPNIEGAGRKEFRYPWGRVAEVFTFEGLKNPERLMDFNEEVMAAVRVADAMKEVG